MHRMTQSRHDRARQEENNSRAGAATQTRGRDGFAMRMKESGQPQQSISRKATSFPGVQQPRPWLHPPRPGYEQACRLTTPASDQCCRGDDDSLSVLGVHVSIDGGVGNKTRERILLSRPDAGLNVCPPASLRRGAMGRPSRRWSRLRRAPRRARAGRSLGTGT